MERSEYQTMAAVETQHWWYGGMRSIAAALLDRYYLGREGLRILDAGGGTSGNALFLERYGQVVALDYAADAADLGGERLPGRFTRGSVLDLPYADASFDLVTSFDVLYHQGVPDEFPALAEMRRVLKPAGRLLMRLPAYQFLYSKHDRAVHTRRRYTARAVHDLLEMSGFAVERLTYVLTSLFPLAAAQRLIERTLPTLERAESDLALPNATINRVLSFPLALEAAWLEIGGSLPFGLSIIALAQRKENSEFRIQDSEDRAFPQ
jgi:ubiquinone/menaquinone biosynthesis C-methylase UbiE